MEHKFRLSITANYHKVIVQLLLLIACFILIGIAIVVFLEKTEISLNSIPLEFIIPILVVTMIAVLFLFIRVTYIIDELWFTEHYIASEKIDKIYYADIKKCSLLTSRGNSSYMITLENGKKIALGATNQHSEASKKIFFDFIEILEDKINSLPPSP
ncbi:hypothetical protein ACFSTE_17895 [Aquimarina hainanensis]|uniref:PH domain-containing protein n=1 Tax=Aquimarina hainanensis TaxID=1578017 RepID=A0ABW5NCJ2_9FLAO